MSDIPCIAVVIEGGVFQTILIERWPDQFRLPRIVAEFEVGNEIEEALRHVKVPTVYESSDRQPCLPARYSSRWKRLAPVIHNVTSFPH
jgi:hypothetical protein